MEALRGQVAAVVEELNAVRAESVSVKSAYANLHQTTVESNQTHARSLAEQVDRLNSMGQTLNDMKKNGAVADPDGKRSKLIEPKHVGVGKFAGALSDPRSKFLE